MKKIIISLVLVTNFAFSNVDDMITILKSTYSDIKEFIEDSQDKKEKDKLSYALESTNEIFKYFLKKIDEIIKEINLEDPLEIYAEKFSLVKAMEALINDKFIEIDDELKKSDTLFEYKYLWFKKAILIYIKAKVIMYKYYITEDYENKSGDKKYNYRLANYKKEFDNTVADLLEFIYKNIEIYKKGLVFMKRVFLIDDSSLSYSLKDEQTFGDVDVLIEFLKGKFKDYQGIGVRYVTFQQTKTSTSRDTGIVLLMEYKPVPFSKEISDIREIEVIVQGDNLEDIITFTMNQAGNIANMKVTSENKNIVLSTKDINYKEMVKENLVFSNTVILKANLISKKKIKLDKDKEGLEVALKIKIGNVKN
ncbi:MAG TPA: hypothetical protein PKW55_08460 [Spirochaetota bacterium]|nr:hypothetical protein [Spirochaetota bacterium]HOM39019.1 hypothetical protein [Spirochaetota bacterium]HPQ49935.1 hypothetical protein [Spirochaetota bacterium]